MAFIINLILFCLFKLITSSSPIVQLTDYNFTNFTKENPYTLLVIYSDSCAKCESLLKEINIANEYISNLNPPSLIATINAEDNNTRFTSDYLNINSVPLMFLSNEDKYMEYKGLPLASSIITFILKNSGKAINTLTTLEHIKDFINPHTMYMSVIYFNSAYDKQFANIAKDIPFSLFAKCESDDCIKYWQPQSDYMILKPFELQKYQRVDLNYTSESNALKSIYHNSISSMGKIADFGIDLLFRNEISSICFIEVNKNNDRTELTNFVDKHYQEYYVFTFDIKDKTDIEFLSFFGYEPEDFKSNEIFLIDFPTKPYAIYKMKQDQYPISVKSIEDFLSQAKEQLIQREKRSEAEPKEHARKNLKVIVGKTFEREVLQNKKQIVIIGYVIANCEKCDLLQQIFDRVSEKFVDNDDILFALIDPVSNEIPNFKIDTPFSPLVYYYHKDKSLPYVVLNKEITTKNILDFIKEQSPKETKTKEYKEEL